MTRFYTLFVTALCLFFHISITVWSSYFILFYYEIPVGYFLHRIFLKNILLKAVRILIFIVQKYTYHKLLEIFSSRAISLLKNFYTKNKSAGALLYTICTVFRAQQIFQNAFAWNTNLQKWRDLHMEYRTPFWHIVVWNAWNKGSFAGGFLHLERAYFHLKILVFFF